MRASGRRRQRGEVRTILKKRRRTRVWCDTMLLYLIKIRGWSEGDIKNAEDISV